MGYIAPKHSLRAKSVNEPTTLQLALARTIDLIEYIRRAPEHLIELDKYFSVDGEFRCRLDHACGTPACVAGHAVIRYAPAHLYAVKEDDDDYGSVSPTETGDNFLFINGMAEKLLLANNAHTYIFKGRRRPYLMSQREEALSRLRSHRDNLKQRIKQEQGG
jgi:hypothetical protein